MKEDHVGVGFHTSMYEKGFLHEGLAKVDQVKLRWHELESTMWENVGGNILEGGNPNLN